LNTRFWGVVPAAGVGARMGADRPKQYLDLLGKTVIEHTLERLLAAELFIGIAVSVSPEDPYWPQLTISRHPLVHTAPGGRERAESVKNGLEFLAALARPTDWVLVHDAARPCVHVDDIRRLAETLHDDPVGGILAQPVHDTLKRVEQGSILETVDRRQIWRALTPQMFRLGALHQALNDAAARGQIVTDEASALELQGQRPRIVEGRPDNIKITRPEDLSLAAFYLEQQQ
jgi:2-C-methyl-D-erythritol 4-phosphate cytidylyltransferase